MTWQASKARLYIAQNLSFIEEVYTRLRAEAYFHASDHEIPGGDALVMLGPRADVEAWNYVKLSAIMGRLRLGHADATRHQLMIELEAIERDNHEIEPPLSFRPSPSPRTSIACASPSRTSSRKASAPTLARPA
jgi:hypothetical protein